MLAPACYHPVTSVTADKDPDQQHAGTVPDARHATVTTATARRTRGNPHRQPAAPTLPLYASRSAARWL